MADTQLFGTMCTDIGNAAIANSVLTGTKVNFSQIAVGDADGTPYVPVSGMTALKHQVWSGPIAEVSQDPQEANRMILHAVLPSSVGGWVMREIGVLDDKGRLIAIGNTPEIPKEVVTTGAIMEMDLYIYISVVDARGVNVIIDPTVVIASKADVSKLQQLLQAHKDDTVAHMTQAQKDQLAAAVPDTRSINGHALSGNVTITKSDLGLGNVDNTRDADKRVAYADSTNHANSVGSYGGVVETGKYFDFHESNSTADYDMRLWEISSGGGFMVSAAPPVNNCLRPILTLNNHGDS